MHAHALHGAATSAQNVSVHLNGERWWVTALVAVGAALLGSVVGGFATYRANLAAESRRRQAIAEIRRKAKVYTPIREELISLAAAIQEGRHLGYRGILKEHPDYQTMVPAAVLATWREYIEDGRASTAASKGVQKALNRIESVVDTFNETLVTTRETFEQRGTEIAEAAGFEITIINWVESYTAGIIKNGISETPLITGFGAPTEPTAEMKAFIAAWEADPAIRDAIAALRELEQTLMAAIQDAIAALDEAMGRIAERYEREPDD